MSQQTILYLIGILILLQTSRENLIIFPTHFILGGVSTLIFLIGFIIVASYEYSKRLTEFTKYALLKIFLTYLFPDIEITIKNNNFSEQNKSEEEPINPFRFDKNESIRKQNNFFCKEDWGDSADEPDVQKKDLSEPSSEIKKEKSYNEPKTNFLPSQKNNSGYVKISSLKGTTSVFSPSNFPNNIEGEHKLYE